MQSGNTYNAAGAFALLLIGPPKGGKTVFATCFPRPWILDADNNLAGAVRYHAARGVPIKDYFFDDPNKMEKDGTLIPRPMEHRWDFTIKAVMEAVKSPDVSTIFVDGLTLAGQYLEAHILAHSKEGNGMKDLIIAGEKVMNQSHWNPFKTMMFKLVMACRSAGKPFIMSCHELSETNDSGAVISYRPLISGQLRGSLAGFFTDCWRMESEQVPISAAKHPTGVKYSVRFAPRNLHQIGNSLGIKTPELDVTNKSRAQVWAELAPYLGMDKNLVS